MAAKKSTVRKVADTVKDAALAVVHAADDHVVHPVGEALGLIKKPEPKSRSARKAARKEQMQKAVARKSFAARTMSSGVTAAKPLKNQGKPGKGPEPRGGSRPGW